MKPLHFLHSQIKTCPGYSKFLNNQLLKKIYPFNLWFFFASPFWLVNNKMLGHYFLMLLTYLNLITLTFTLYGSNLVVGISFYIAVVTFLHVTLCFLSHKIYQAHLENQFYKVNYDQDKSLKITKAYPAYIQALIHIILPLFTLFVYMFSSAIGNFIALRLS